MPSPQTITEIENDDSEIDGLQQCLDYLSTYEDPPVPVRSPRRQGKHNYEGKVKVNAKSKLQEMPLPEQDELLMNDASSSEYIMGSDGSSRSSIFSSHSNYVQKKPDVDFASDLYMEDVYLEYSICTIDNVVTIARKHDRWDPKKVSLVNIRSC